MKHKTGFIIGVAWITALLVCGVFTMLFSEKQSTESDKENRYLQSFPSVSPANVFSGNFRAQFEDFLSDNFIGRDSIVDSTDSVLNVFNALSDDAAFEQATKQMEQELGGIGDDDAETETAGGTEVTVTEDGDTTDGGENALENESDEPDEVISADTDVYSATTAYLWFDKADGTKYIEYSYKKSDIETYAETLRIMQTYLPEDGNINFIQVPLASMANRWRNQQRTYTGWGSSVEPMLIDALKGTERINVFSAYDLLRPYICGKTPMFYFTDHHWTAEGAYIAASAMIEKMGWEPVPYNEYSWKAVRGKNRTEQGVRDTFNVLTPLYSYESYVIDKGVKTPVKLMATGAYNYRIYLSGTKLPWRVIESDANTGRKCLIICDSFGNVLAPYLMAYYDEIHMCDFRSGSYNKSGAGGSIGENIERYGIDDVYIVTSTANGLRKKNSLIYLRKYLTE